MVYVDDKAKINEIKNWLAVQPGITEVYDKDGAVAAGATKDRIGDLVVLSARDVVPWEVVPISRSFGTGWNFAFPWRSIRRNGPYDYFASFKSTYKMKAAV